MNSPQLSVPFIDLHQQYLSIKEEIDQALQMVLQNTEFIGGASVEHFEQDFARRVGAPYCIGVANGTDALHLSLKVLGVGPGDAVLVPANTFIATAEAVTLAGAKPLFIDCDPQTYLLDLNAVERVLDQAKSRGIRVRAMIPVHLYGRAVAMDAVMAIAHRHDLLVIEDCAQAHLAQHRRQSVGTFGNVGCFSFFPGKNLGAYGDAGAIVTNDPDLATRLRMLRNHGRNNKYDHVFEGVNSRLDSLQAAVLSVKLRHLERWNTQRAQHARRYIQELGDIKTLVLPECPAEEKNHVFHLFVVRCPNRDALKTALEAEGIKTGIHYPAALPNSEAYRYLGHKPQDFPVASAYQNQILSLPMYPELTPQQIQQVTQRLRHHLLQEQRA